MTRQYPQTQGAVSVFIRTPSVRQTVERTLLENGYNPLVAQSESEIIDFCASREVQLLILDTPSITLAKSIRALQGHFETPILACVDHSKPEEIDRAFALGATDCIAVPVHPQILVRRVHEQLYTAKLTQRNADTTVPISFKTFVDQAPLPMHSVTHDGKMVYVNQRWLELFGYRREEVIGEPTSKFFVYNDFVDITKRREQLWSARNVQNYPLRIRHANGNAIPVLIDSQLMTSDTGELVSITSLRLLEYEDWFESSLKISSQQMIAILNAMNEGVFVINAEGRYVQIPSLLNTRLNLPMHQYVGRTLHELIPQAKADAFVQVVREVIRTKKSRSLEQDLVIEGVQRWFYVTVTPLNDQEAVIVTRDISEERQKEAKLRDSERLYQHLFNSATESVMLIDLDTGSILEANASAAYLLGYTVDELRTMNIRDIEQPTAPQDNTTTASMHAVSADQTLLIEQQYRHKSGKLIPVESNARIITYQGRAAILDFARDISQRKRLLENEKELRQLAEVMRDSAAALNRTVTLDDVLDTAMTYVRRIIPAPCANVMLVDDQKIARVMRCVGYDALGISEQETLAIALPVRATKNLHVMVKSGKPLKIDDIAHYKEWVKVKAVRLMRAYLGAPIMVKDKLFGFLNLDSPEVGFFADKHLEPLQAFTNQVAIAIQNALLFQQIQEDKQHLEERVQQRTHELTETNRRLQTIINELRATEDALDKERSMLQLIMDSVSDMIYVKDTQERYTVLNRATWSAMGVRSAEEAIGKTVFDFYPEDYARLHSEIDRRILTTGEPLVNMDNTMLIYDGTYHRQLLSKYPLRDARGRIIGIVGINRDVTHLRYIEERLNEERELLAQVLTSARCLLWVGTVERQDKEYVWNVQIVNEAAAYALLPLDLKGRDYVQAWQESIVPEDAQRRKHVLQAHLQFNRQNLNQELRCLRMDGSVMWLVENVQMRELEAGKRWRLFGVCTDITDLKTAEATLRKAYSELDARVQARTKELVEANEVLRQEIAERKRLQEAERRQRLLAETLNQSIAVINTSFERDFILDFLLDSIDDIVPHDAANIMLISEDGETAEVVRYRGYDQTMKDHKHYLPKYPNKLEIVQTRKPFIITDTHAYNAWTHEPGFDWIRANLCVPIIVDDKIIGFLTLDSATPNTFTEQHAEWLMAFANQAALAIRNASILERIRNYTFELEQNVQARTAQLRAVLEAMRDGIIYRDMNGMPQYTNRALTELTGYELADWRAQRIENTLLVANEDERERLNTRFQRLLELQNYVEEDVSIQRKDGTVLMARLIKIYVLDDAQHRIGTLTLVRDISQAKQLEEQKARFIANASHELRTPIANIKTRLFLMRRQPERFTEHVEIAEQVTRYMQHLVEDMFDLARFERGTIQLKREPVVIQELVNSAIQNLVPEAERKSIALVQTLPSAPITLKVDPYRMLQVLNNLLVNALNYTPPQGKIEVTLIPEGESGQMKLMVADTGIGIAEEHMAQLFKPFYRANHDIKGAGLGLSIAREIVQLHGGDISVESKVGVGTCFTVRLPLQNDEEAVTA